MRLDEIIREVKNQNLDQSEGHILANFVLETVKEKSLSYGRNYIVRLLMKSINFKTVQKIKC